MSAREGHFVWYDLITADVNGAKRFYADVVGWATRPFEASNGTYAIWTMADRPLGGVTALPDDAKRAGATSHWMAHVVVADVDAATRTATALGATVQGAPHDIPGVGRFSVVADPQGAEIALFTPNGPLMPPPPEGTPGHVVWHELLTTDQAAALRFYGDLFGWSQVDALDMGPMGTYVMYGKDGQAMGGIMTKPDGYPFPPHFLYYVHVDDLDAATARTQAAGGQVLNGPMEIPGGNRIVQGIDPQGATFALHGK